jgi:SAM-dependent MidA family methyltransferase
VSGDARRRIVRTIRERGPIAFDAFMELALYGEGGYFEGTPVGRAGDFVTSPHVHPWFAYGLALALGELHEGLAAAGVVPTEVPVRLVELGAGDGTLARQLREVLAGAGSIEYTAVERSERARAALRGAGVDVRSSIAELDLRGALVFANELLDNLPFRRVRGRSDALVELLVGLDDDRPIEVEIDAPSWLVRLAPPLADGDEAAVPTGALELIDALAVRMRGSYALLIDYSSRRGADVHGYRGHRVVADVLERPGANDITAGVDLEAIDRRAGERGLAVLGRTTQRDALLALGFAEWGRRAREASTARDAPDARSWASRSRATLLVDPAGLGAHRWLLLGTAGLPVPGWLTTAGERPSAD